MTLPRLIIPHPPAPALPQNLQDMDGRRTVKLGETYRGFAEVERRVIPIISKCLEGMVSAAKAVDEKRVSLGPVLDVIPYDPCQH